MAKQRKGQVSYQLFESTDDFIAECQDNFEANTGGKISKIRIVDALVRKGAAVWDSVKKPKGKK